MSSSVGLATRGLGGVSLQSGYVKATAQTLRGAAIGLYAARLTREDRHPAVRLKYCMDFPREMHSREPVAARIYVGAI
ncbi:MAG: hypothetical protein ABI471_05140 [Sphingomonas bacterium]